MGLGCNVAATKFGFVSYAHKDHVLFGDFEVHLKTIERQFPDLQVWVDTDIVAGEAWKRRIMEQIDRADLFILLVSPAFIGSDFIFLNEIPAIRRRLAANAVVVPVYLRRCLVGLVCSDLHAVPHLHKELMPIEEWPQQNAGFDAVREHISTAIEKRLGLTPAASWLALP